eukprot:7472946-Ditylum_brightwellii.AAC.1
MADAENIQIVSNVTEDKWPTLKDMSTGEELTKAFRVCQSTPKDGPTKISLCLTSSQRRSDSLRSTMTTEYIGTSRQTRFSSELPTLEHKK